MAALRPRLAAAAVLAALAATGTGCHPRRPPPDLSLDPAQLLAQVRAAQARTASVRGEVRVKVDAPGASGTVPALVAAERPDRLYVQSVDFFGNTVSVLAAAGGQLSLYDARARVLYRGAATTENLARLVPLPLSPEELVDLLCGGAPLLAGAAVAAEPGRGFVTLELADGERTQTLRVGPGARVESSATRVAGTRAQGTYDVTFRARDQFEGTSFPGEVALTAEKPPVKMSLGWIDVEPNAQLDAGLFTPPPPKGARIVDLADAAAPAGLFPDATPPPKP